MFWMKHVRTNLVTSMFTRRGAAMGLLGCLMLAFLPIGCANSILAAPLRYREQHQNEAHLLPDITVERLQECLEKYGHQLESESYPVEAKIQVNQEGRNLGVVVVEGFPESAPDLAACTRIALREMAVPMSVLQLRHGRTTATTNGQTKPTGNEVANPIVAWEIAAALAEFAAEHGGRTVLYTVTIEVLSAAAVAAVAVAITRTQKNRCKDHYEKCVASELYRNLGRGAGDSRCGACINMCISKGEWPDAVGNGTCTYWK